MTEMSNFDVLTIIVTVLAAVALTYGIWAKRRLDKLTRLIEREEDELARHSAE